MNKTDTFIDNVSIKIFAIIKQIAIIFLYLLLSILISSFCYKSIMSTNTWVANAGGIFSDLCLLTIFILIFRKTIVPDFYDFKKNGLIYIKKYWYYWVIGLLVMVISNGIISSFIGLPSNEEGNRIVLMQLPIYATITMVIFAPITEELMTRVLLNKAFKNPLIYALLSGIIFGSLHLLSATNKIEMLYIIPYSALGVALSLIYKKSNNIWTNIFFHSLHNFIALTIIFMGV